MIDILLLIVIVQPGCSFSKIYVHCAAWAHHSMPITPRCAFWHVWLLCSVHVRQC